MPSLCHLCSQISFLDLPPFPYWLGDYETPILDSELVPFVPKEKSPSFSKGEGKLEEKRDAWGLQHVFPTCFYPQTADAEIVSAVLGTVHSEEQYRAGAEEGLRHVFPSCFYSEAPSRDEEERAGEGLRHIFPACFYPPAISTPQTPILNPPKITSYRSLGLPHHSSIAALQEAAKSCSVCALMKQSVDRVRKTYEEACQDEDWASWYENGPPTYEFFMSQRKEGEDGFLLWSMAKKTERAYLVGAVGFCVDDENSLKDHFRGRVVSLDPTTPVVLNRMRNWVANCSESHSTCSPRKAVHLPFRAIDVADPSQNAETVRLVEPEEGAKGVYISLSHCWGTSPQFTTTKATMAERKAGIDLKQLPQTFQDAILIARELDIRYIWIDSLCICQDDGADWERESAKMASIYMRSFLTIAASRGKDDSEGFLSPREARDYVELPVTIGSSNGTIHLFNIPLNYAANGEEYANPIGEPLQTRGWVLQERFLAHRSLHFGASQISYECLHGFETEDGYKTNESIFNVDELLIPEDHDMQYRGSKRWNLLLEQYSRRNLSWQSDKLPALSGLARIFQERFGDEYVAGLWRSQIVEGMCWQCVPSAKGEHTRPKEYTAPSWSWASVIGEFAITFIGGWDDLVEIINVGVEVKGLNPHGQVVGGILELRGVLERIWVTELHEHEVPDPNFFTVSTKNGVEFYPVFDIELEGKREVVEGLEMYILPLAADSVCYALIVVPAMQGSYQRKGYILLDEEKDIQRWTDLKENGDLSSIVLV